jgi:hypothetical protein
VRNRYYISKTPRERRRYEGLFRTGNKRNQERPACREMIHEQSVCTIRRKMTKRSNLLYLMPKLDK